MPENKATTTQLPATPAEMAIVAVEMIMTHGVPLYLQTMRALETDNPTLAQVNELRNMVRDPEEFFKG